MPKCEYQFQDEGREVEDGEVQNANRDEHLCKVRKKLLKIYFQ